MSEYHTPAVNVSLPRTINRSSPTTTGTVDSRSNLVINTTSRTSVDANGQSVDGDGIDVVMNGNGSFLGVSLQNKNAGALASTDLVFFNDATTDIVNGPYFDIGMTSSNGSNPLYTVLPVGAYLFTTTYDLAIGTAAAKDVILHAGGTLAANEVVRVKNTGPMLVQNQTALPAGGATTSYIGTSSTAAMGVYWGSGAPTVSAAKGSLYLRSDGSGTGDRMYVNTNGATTWTAVTTAA